MTCLLYLLCLPRRCGDAMELTLPSDSCDVAFRCGGRAHRGPVLGTLKACPWVGRACSTLRAGCWFWPRSGLSRAVSSFPPPLTLARPVVHGKESADGSSALFERSHFLPLPSTCLPAMHSNWLLMYLGDSEVQQLARNMLNWVGRHGWAPGGPLCGCSGSPWREPGLLPFAGVEGCMLDDAATRAADSMWHWVSSVLVQCSQLPRRCLCVSRRVAHRHRCSTAHLQAALFATLSRQPIRRR